MRKIIAGLYMSLDGVVEAPETWHFPYLDHEMGQVVEAMYAESDMLLLGRITYSVYAATWPYQDGELADRINGVRKVVASTTLKVAGWHNSTIVSGNIAGEVIAMKRRPGKSILTPGSITLTRSLLAAGLIDELRLLVHPIVLGKGRRLFAEGTFPLRLAASATFSTGVLDLRYQPDGSAIRLPLTSITARARS